MVHDFFNWCVWVLEVIGHQTGWGYELANIIIFVIIEPGLIIVFFILWQLERRAKAYALPFGIEAQGDQRRRGCLQTESRERRASQSQ